MGYNLCYKDTIGVNGIITAYLSPTKLVYLYSIDHLLHVIVKVSGQRDIIVINHLKM